MSNLFGFSIHKPLTICIYVPYYYSIDIFIHFVSNKKELIEFLYDKKGKSLAPSVLFYFVFHSSSQWILDIHKYISHLSLKSPQDDDYARQECPPASRLLLPPSSSMSLTTTSTTTTAVYTRTHSVWAQWLTIRKMCQMFIRVRWSVCLFVFLLKLSPPVVFVDYRRCAAAEKTTFDKIYRWPIYTKRHSRPSAATVVTESWVSKHTLPSFGHRLNGLR